MKKETRFEIETSDKFGDACCSETCPHLEQYTKFPPQFICKPTGKVIEPDNHGRLLRVNACKYLFEEEVPDRFWSPLKGL